MPQLIADHGHLMHLFLLRTPGLDRMWHLHPMRSIGTATSRRICRQSTAGHYQVFADVVDKSGFPWTLIGAIEVPKISAASLSGDDSAGSAEALTANSQSSITKVGEITNVASDVLADSTRVLWRHDALRANVQMSAPARPSLSCTSNAAASHVRSQRVMPPKHPRTVREYVARNIGDLADLRDRALRIRRKSFC